MVETIFFCTKLSKTITNENNRMLLVFDGLFLSNGPGDPVKCQQAISSLKKWINNRNHIKPVYL
jgi:carbamoylphosphate synthase small subunit